MDDGWAGTIIGMPSPGASAERSKAVGMRDIELFTQITGDRNPLHYDERAARESLFKGLIVQGGITSGILNAIVAEDLPYINLWYLDNVMVHTNRVRNLRLNPAGNFDFLRSAELTSSSN